MKRGGRAKCTDVAPIIRTWRHLGIANDPTSANQNPHASGARDHIKVRNGSRRVRSANMPFG